MVRLCGNKLLSSQQLPGTAFLHEPDCRKEEESEGRTRAEMPFQNKAKENKKCIDAMKSKSSKGKTTVSE
jgi:hypothetical protein